MRRGEEYGLFFFVIGLGSVVLKRPREELIRARSQTSALYLCFSVVAGHQHPPSRSTFQPLDRFVVIVGLQMLPMQWERCSRRLQMHSLLTKLTVRHSEVSSSAFNLRL